MNNIKDLEQHRTMLTTQEKADAIELTDAFVAGGGQLLQRVLWGMFNARDLWRPDNLRGWNSDLVAETVQWSLAFEHPAAIDAEKQRMHSGRGVTAYLNRMTAAPRIKRPPTKPTLVV